MKTSYILVSFALLFGTLLSSCIKHEVIPAPEPLVDLEVHFEGNINGTDVEYTNDVDGFNGETSDAQLILTSPSPSSVSYFCNMTSNLIDRSLKVGIGSIYWDAGALEKPSVEEFNAFFEDREEMTGIPYTSGAVDGFEVSYTDNFGNVWVSDPTSTNPQTVLFKEITTESDNTGDYAKFKVEFSCYLYRTINTLPLERDSISITDGVFDGWFKR
ncbi:MAG: hypothetical protein K0R65_2602 [Crocinitomicaceae bacterium]|jgi:hypothetical protein|nr:hypothetical protein [Crocinitomicaceae bacterium]